MQNFKNFLTSERWFLPIFVLLLGIHLFWIGSLRVYPFVDVPYHLAESTIYRYYGQPTNEFDQYYSKKSRLLPNTFYMLFCASPIFPTVESANRIYFCLYVLLLPTSIFLIVRQLNGSIWFSLLSFLLLHNYNVHWGFGGFVLSIPVFFLFFYLLMRSVHQDSVGWGILRSFWLLLLFFIHGLTGLFGLMFFFLHSLYQYRGNFRILARKGVVAVPTLFLAFRWWFFGRSPGNQWNPASIHDYFTGTYLETLELRATLLINDNKWLFPERLGDVVALLLTMFILIPLLNWLRKKWGTGFRNNVRGSAGSVYLLLFASLACWFLMPGRVPGQSYIFDRFSVFCLLAIILLLGVGSAKITSGWKVWIVTGCVLHALLWSDYYHDFQKENTSFTAEFFPEGKDQTLCGIIYDKKFRGRNVYQHFPLYYIVWKQGISCARFIDMRYVTLIRRKASFKELPKYEEDVGRRSKFVISQYGNVDYLLVRPNPNPRIPKALGNFRLLRFNGRWLLYERRTR